MNGFRNRSGIGRESAGEWILEDFRRRRIRAEVGAKEGGGSTAEKGRSSETSAEGSTILGSKGVEADVKSAVEVDKEGHLSPDGYQNVYRRNAGGPDDFSGLAARGRRKAKGQAVRRYEKKEYTYGSSREGADDFYKINNRNG